MAAITTAILATAAVAGVGMSAYGTIQSSKAAKANAAAQQQMIQQEQQAEALRRQAMELDARRRQLEVVRQQQRARSMGLAAANAQGAMFGSGLQGGYGQIAGQSGVNMLGIQQNLGLGQQMFDVNAQISQSKIAMAQAQSQASQAAGLTSLGGSIISALPTIGNIAPSFGNFFNSNPVNVGSATSYSKYG